MLCLRRWEWSRCGITSSYVNRLIKKSENIVNKTFIQMLESLEYSIGMIYVKWEDV